MNYTKIIEIFNINSIFRIMGETIGQSPSRRLRLMKILWWNTMVYQKSFDAEFKQKAGEYRPFKTWIYIYKNYVIDRNFFTLW